MVGYGTRDVGGDAQAQRAAFHAAVPGVERRRFALFLGRLDRKKGLDLLIEAFGRVASKYPDFDLVIAGPDLRGLQASLTQQAQGCGIGSRLHWPGMLSGDVKIGAYRAAEFFVLPSHQENFGVVVAESLATATPVLITNKVNIWREVEADGAAVVVDDTADDVARGLLAMLALGAAERTKMAAAARACFVSRYDLEKNAMDLLVIIEKSAGLNRRL
jgi:glycosyltransferase involved in cell wall biosynthesis